MTTTETLSATVTMTLEQAGKLAFALMALLAAAEDCGQTEVELFLDTTGEAPAVKLCTAEEIVSEHEVAAIRFDA